MNCERSLVKMKPAGVSTQTFLDHRNADIEKMPRAAYNSYALWKPINLPSNISNLIKKQIESVEFLKFQSSNLY